MLASLWIIVATLFICGAVVLSVIGIYARDVIGKRR